MDTLSSRFQGIVNGVIEGFDRIVFKGILKPICYAEGMSVFLYHRQILRKDYKPYWEAQSKVIVRDAEEYTRNAAGQKITYIGSLHDRKEEMAHENQKLLDIQTGLIGTWSCVEACRTFKSAYNPNAPTPVIQSTISRCKYLYFYFDHQDYGFMSVRLQTWAPFDIQIALNGREWLRRQLSKAGIGYTVEGNKFLQIDDYDIAQQLLLSQRNVMWEQVLTGFLPDVFPSMKSIVGDMTYTWTLWQSEWARDYIFSDPSALQQHMGYLIRHAFMTGNGDRVLQYMGKPVRPNGQPYSDPELMTKLNTWYDGARLRHWVNGNSIKVYNEHNVLRVEMTMNDPRRYRVHRHTEGDPDGQKKLLPMRKGIADVYVRSQVCEQRVQCFTEHMAALTEDQTVGQILSQVVSPVTREGKRYRALDVTGKDLALLQALSNPKFDVAPITNKKLRATLAGTPWANALKDSKLSARVSRNLRLLREHGIIRKGEKRTYELTKKGRLLTTALNQLLSASINDLTRLAS